MDPPDYSDNWRRYWKRTYDGTRRVQLENAAVDPLGRWLIADAPILVDERGDADIGIEPAHLRDYPDLVISAGRDGFETFVDDQDLDRPPFEDIGYESLPIHLTSVGLITGIDFEFADPLGDANALTQIPNARITASPSINLHAAIRTYRCPAGHETTLHRSLTRPSTIERCGEPRCTNEVTLDDTRTSGQRIATFSIEHDGIEFPCVATGRYSHPPARTIGMADADRLEITGILRLVSENDTVQPTYEVLHAEPM